MRTVLTWSLVLFWPLFAAAAPLELTPASFGAGEVALLEYRGEAPAVALGRFQEKVFFMSPNEQGATALIGVDVDAEPGDYPLRVAVADRLGRTQFHEMTLRIRPVDRPVERLTLPERMVSPTAPSILRRIARESKLLGEIFERSQGEFLPAPLRLPVGDPVGSPFGLRRILNGIPKSPHSGVDFRSPRGTPVRAPIEGKVVFAGDLYFTGLTVILDHGGGLCTYYAHLHTMEVEQGDRIVRGEALGAVGSTGRSTGPHLHWGAKLRGDRVDPLVLREVLERETP